MAESLVLVWAAPAPDGDLLRLCSQFSGNSSNDDCWRTVSRSNEKFDSLLKLVSGGNTPAAKYLAPHVKALDGGNLEDALIALGEFSDKNMEQFLDLARQGSLNEHELTSAITMLSSTYTDQLEAQLAEMNKRRALLEQVSTPELRKYRDVALPEVDSFIGEIQRAMTQSR